MVWPILAGAAAGIGGMLLGGETKKEATVYHAPYETYSPQTTDARVWNVQYPNYQVMMNSPLASQTTKKEMSTAIDQRPEQSVAPVGGSQTTGTNMTTIALIAGGALVLYGFLSGRKK